VRAGLTLGDDLEGAPPWRYLRVRLSELFPGVRLRRSHADFAAVHQRLAGIRVLDYCVRVHMPAWVWTVDDEVDIARFMHDPRVAVLITNRPDIAMRIRKA
jgi:glycerophosphoryl diester phosphodiesterase